MLSGALVLNSPQFRPVSRRHCTLYKFYYFMYLMKLSNTDQQWDDRSQSCVWVGRLCRTVAPACTDCMVSTLRSLTDHTHSRMTATYAVRTTITLKGRAVTRGIKHLQIDAF